MKSFLNQFRRLVRLWPEFPIEKELKPSCIGRIASVMTFMVIIAFPISWVGAFFLLKETQAIQSIPADLLDSVLCISFFGGLVVSVVLGGLVGSILRRTFWRISLHRKEREP